MQVEVWRWFEKHSALWKTFSPPPGVIILTYSSWTLSLIPVLLRAPFFLSECGRRVWRQSCCIFSWWIISGKAELYEANPYGSYHKHGARGHHSNTTSNGLLTGLLMSTNKASCRNTTSPPWHLELLSNQVFSHTFRPWEFAFSPSRHRGRETERVKDRTRQLRESEIWAAAPATRCLHREDSPHGPAIFIWAQSGHRQPHGAPIPHSKLLSGLTRTSSLHPVCQQVWVHTINLERESGREDGGGEFAGGGRGGKVGQRTQTEAKAAAPFSTSVFLQHPPRRPRLLSEVWRWQLVRDLWEVCRLVLALLYQSGSCMQKCF